MVTFIFEFGQRKGQFQVKLGQIRPNLKIQNFLSKTFLSCPVSSQGFKNVIYVYVRLLEAPKNAFQNVTASPLPVVFGHGTTKNKDIALKFRMRVVCMYVDHIYSGF